MLTLQSMFKVKSTDRYYFCSGKQNKSTSSFVRFSSLKVIFLAYSSFFNNQAKEKEFKLFQVKDHSYLVQNP